MKKALFFPAVPLLLLAASCPGVSSAQLFKQLLNTVKSTAQNRANDKASQSTNQVLDKADGATQINSKSGSATGSTVSSGAGASMPGDTASTNRVLGAFARAAAGNPNDTSGADITMKALGLLTSGGGVSAADSAAAIKGFMTASGGSGYFFQYQMTVNSKKGVSKDTTTSWFTSAGNARSEMRINMPGASGGKIINIAHAAQRQYSLLLDPDDKTYSLNVIDTALINSGGGETYQVTRIGSETVGGYSCIHSKMTSTLGSGAFKSTTSFDIWTSTAVPGYALFRKMGSVQHVKPKMMAALDNAGAGGFLVKMASGDKEYSMTMLLSKAEAKTFPAALFMIPAGYKQSQETMISQMLSGPK